MLSVKQVVVALIVANLIALGTVACSVERVRIGGEEDKKVEKRDLPPPPPTPAEKVPL